MSGRFRSVFFYSHAGNTRPALIGVRGNECADWTCSGPGAGG